MYDNISYCMTPQEEKIRVNARIPKNLYDFVCAEYDNVSQAINEGLENLRESKSRGMSYKTDSDIQASHTQAYRAIQEPLDVIQESHTPYDSVIHSDIQVLTARTEEQKARIEDYQTQVKTLNAEITRLQNVIMESPDPMEFVRLQERIEGLQSVLEEREKRIHELNSHYENISSFANYFKSNEPKLIEAPAADKKRPWYKRIFSS